MSTHGEEHAAVTFIKALFGHTTESVYACTLANDKGASQQPPERSLCDRDTAALTAFINRWDRDGRGLYFSCSTIKAGNRRQKPNAVETPALWVDIDFKSIREDPATAEKKLTTLRCPPNFIVRSGHGLHAYWVFKEAVPTQDNLERLEVALRQLAELLGGDFQVCQVVALMRLPGTKNTKSFPHWVVECTAGRSQPYELDDLEEWLCETSPVLTRKIRPKPPDQNPYLAIAEKLGFKPPVDVEDRLAAMTYQGAGDAAIHATQLAVTAALINRDVALDQVVTTVLDATRAAAGDYGQHWNWAKEETNIRRMCQSWRGKIAVERGDAVDIGQARAARAKLAPAPVEKKSKKPHLIAETVLASLIARDEALLFEQGLAWHYADGIWTRKADCKSWLNTQIEHVCERIGISSDNRLINEARGLIERKPNLNAEKVAWDQHGMVPTRSGLIDPLTLQLTAACPEHRVTWRVDCDFVPDAACPIWLQMLEDTFADRSSEGRAAVISTLQEVVGAALLDVKPRELHKALVLFGGPNSGKSQLLKVMGGLFGENCIAQPIGAVEKAHGLMPFQRRLPWVLNEAFNQNVWHLSDLVKTLITGEEVSIDIKHGPMLPHRFLGPIFWATNPPPQFKESTRAVIDRLVVIACERHFDGGHPVGAELEARRARLSGPGALVLAREKEGVLMWALEGLRRALKRGEIQLAPESTAAAARIYQDSNLVAGFVDECVDYDPNGRVSMPDFCVAVACWYAENKGEDRRLPSNDSIGKALVALHDPQIIRDRHELRDSTARYVIGVKLNTHGLDYHERGTSANLFEGKTVQTTTSGGAVNRSIPSAWDAKPKVVAMRAAHVRHAEKCKKQVSPSADTPGVTKADCASGVSPTEVPEPLGKPLFE